MVPDIGDITADHSPTPIQKLTEAVALEGTPHVSLPSTAAACTALQPMDAPITPHTVIPTGIVTHPTLTIHSCHSMDWSQSHSSSYHHAAQDSQPSKIKQHPRLSTPHKSHHPKTVTIQDSPSDSSLDSDSDSEPLNNYGPLPAVMKMGGEEIL